jgi:nitrite reductase (NADH) large subunit
MAEAQKAWRCTVCVAGGSAGFAGIPRSNMLKVLGYDMFSIGQITPEDGSYQFFLFRDSRMLGSILLGDTSLSSRVKEAIETETEFSGALQQRESTAPVTDMLRGM